MTSPPASATRPGSRPAARCSPPPTRPPATRLALAVHTDGQTEVRIQGETVLRGAGQARRPRMVPRRPLAARGLAERRPLAARPRLRPRPRRRRLRRPPPLRHHRPHPRLVLLNLKPHLKRDCPPLGRYGEDGEHAPVVVLERDRAVLGELHARAGDEVADGGGGEDLARLRPRRRRPPRSSSAAPVSPPSSRSSHSPVWTPARSDGTTPASALAHRTARAGPSKLARTRPAGASSSRPRKRENAEWASPGSESGTSASSTVVRIRPGSTTVWLELAEERLDRGQHRLLVALPGQVVGAGSADHPRARQPLAHVLAGRAQVLLVAVHDERRHPHGRRARGGRRSPRSCR